MIAPLLALVALAVTWGSHPAVAVVVVIDIFLGGAVLAAVHHAEVIAHRVGEPYGSIVLAVAVTVIEVGLIVTLMISGGTQAETLARDTVFAAVMITCNGIVGVSILTAALRDRVASFNAEGSATAFATVITLTTLCLVLPNFTTSKTGPEFSASQLVFAALASVSLYALFLFVQSVRHRGLFMDPVGEDDAADEVEDLHGEPPTQRETRLSLALLLVALVAVVGLAKTSSHAIEEGVKSIGAPASAVGVVIALLVLMPETLTAWRNARRGRHPGDRGRLDLGRRPARPRPRLDPDRPARPLRHRRRADPAARPLDPAGGWRAPDHLRRLRLSRLQSVAPR
jgi:Ca2+:H+ antiporter